MKTKENKIDISKHLGLVHLCCQRFRKRAIDYEELFQCGCVGLVKAAKNFRFDRQVQFSSYAVPVILGEIKSYFRDNNPMKISRNVKDLALKIKRMQERFLIGSSRSPTISEICSELGVGREQVLDALEAEKPLASLEDLSTSGQEVAKFFDEENISLRLSFAGAFASLSKPDKALIYLRFFRFETQSEIAKKLGMSQVQVSRREKAPLKILRQKLSPD